MEPNVDTDRVSVRQITKAVAKNFVIEHHYSHRFSSCKYALGVFYRDKEEHAFFGGDNEKLIGTIIYGHPVCNRAIQSITSDSSLELGSVLELTRLVIADNFGRNIESHVIASSFRWLKKNAPEIKVLISYADPEQNHAGTIYQATNWLYQGLGASKLMLDYSIRLHDDGPWIPSRTVTSRFKSKNLKRLAETIGHKFYRKEEASKHRYLYFLCGKREKKELLKKLKFPLQPYPDPNTKWTPPIHTIELVNGEVKLTYL